VSRSAYQAHYIGHCAKKSKSDPTKLKGGKKAKRLRSRTKLAGSKKNAQPEEGEGGTGKGKSITEKKWCNRGKPKRNAGEERQAEVKNGGCLKREQKQQMALANDGVETEIKKKGDSNICDGGKCAFQDHGRIPVKKHPTPKDHEKGQISTGGKRANVPSTQAKGDQTRG